MEKYIIEFYSKDFVYKYLIKIKFDYDEFCIERCMVNNQYNCDSLMLLKSKVFLSGYSYINGKKIDKNYYNKEIIEKEFAYHILQSLYINDFSLNILYFLGFDVESLKNRHKKCYIESMKEKYYFNENDDDFNDYDNCYFVYNSENVRVGKLYRKGNNVKLEITYNCNVNFISCLESFNEYLNQKNDNNIKKLK